VVLNANEGHWSICQLKKQKIKFTTKGVDGRFWKLIAYNAFEPSFYRNLYHVYTKYTSLDGVDKNFLTEARLLFGEYEVAVEMPFLIGTTPTKWKDVNYSQVAQAIVYLAANAIIYTDLRLPSIVLVENKSLLVDYDDAVVVDEPVKSYENFIKALGSNGVEISRFDPVKEALEVRFAVVAEDA